MNANDTRSDELLKKKMVYTLSNVPRRKLTAAGRYLKYQRPRRDALAGSGSGAASSRNICTSSRVITTR
jgi:hypothetical protein